MGTTLRRATAAALATGAVALMTTTSAVPAHAAGTGAIASNSGGAYIRAQPNPNSTMYGYFGNGTQLTIYCYTDGVWAQGNYWTNRWFQTNVPSYRYGSPEAYIHASLVSPQPRVGHC